ncbi:metallo-hydrolase [Coleophoma crateriformis]|uniref:Metallo-hydrolase n=1 Tax=Coleophoma crateriformis TaxID=565419 RepID=A0A3D8Q8X7_9HELO|nr:metallo-hydrolase [Coleophoma crateriformis]
MAPPPIIPDSPSTVSVSAIHADGWAYKVPCAGLFNPTYKGLDVLDFCSYSFLVCHGEGKTKQNVLFDLGIRKDWENLPPHIVRKLLEWGTELRIGQHVAENLQENGFQLKDLDAIIWSHLHWDHTGSPSKFPPSAKLIFGPGIASKFMPGWPAVPSAGFREVDLAGREVVGLEEPDFTLNVGGFGAIDYFGDGSFYLLNAPGHSIGHLNALARTTSNPDTFILLAADSVHLGGELRPTEALPLPNSIDVQGIVPRPCPIEDMLQLHRSWA